MRIGCPACRVTLPRRRAKLPRQISQNDVCLTPTLVIRQKLEVIGHRAPTGQSGEQASNPRQQFPQAIAQVRGFADRLVDDRVECDDASDEIPPRRSRLLPDRPRERSGQSCGDLGGKGGELGGESAPCPAEIGPGHHNTRAYNSDADLADAGYGQRESFAVYAPGRTEQIAGDDHRSEASESRPIRGEVAQDRGDEAARSAPDGKTREETDEALRSEAPRLG